MAQRQQSVTDFDRPDKSAITDGRFPTNGKDVPIELLSYEQWSDQIRTALERPGFDRRLAKAWLAVSRSGLFKRSGHRHKVQHEIEFLNALDGFLVASDELGFLFNEKRNQDLDTLTATLDETEQALRKARPSILGLGIYVNGEDPVKNILKDIHILKTLLRHNRELLRPNSKQKTQTKFKPKRGNFGSLQLKIMRLSRRYFGKVRYVYLVALLARYGDKFEGITEESLKQIWRRSIDQETKKNEKLVNSTS